MERRSTLLGVLLVATALAIPGIALAGDHAFVGSSKCKKCHIKQYNAWAETKMAKAFEGLKPGVAAEAKTKAKLDPQKDYTADAACVGCHVTGFGKPGGFKDIASTPDLAGVGCESCHGAGADYITDDKMSLKNKEYKRADIVAAGMTDKVQDACGGCHNDKSPFWPGSFAFDKDKGSHAHEALKYPH